MKSEITENSNKEERKKKTLMISVGIVTLLLACAIIVLAILGNVERAEEVSQSIFFSESVAETEATTKVTTTTTPTTTPTTTTTTVTTAVTFPPFSNGLYKQVQDMKQNYNGDTIAWVRVQGTNVNYAVTKKGENDGANDYYINHDFYNRYSAAGHVFMDFRARFGEKDSEQSDVITLYGHNQANNTMFGSLRYYKTNYYFYEQYPIIELSSLYRDYQYKIFSFMIVDGSEHTDFDYWNYVEFSNQEEYETFMAKLAKHQLIQTNVDVKYTDKLLMLSTCNSGSASDWNRFVIVARRVRDGEDPYAGVAGSVRLR